METPRIVGDRYELVRLLGAGGMGEVYAATDRQTQQQVAVKLLAAPLRGRADVARETSARFTREIQALGRVSSRHAVGVHDAGYDPETGEQFLVMDLLVGEDLGSVAERVGVLPVETVLRLAAQTCEGLAVAHAAGIVHRDIKPGNLFLVADKDGRVVKILDFGIARVIGEANELTQTGAILGSPLYMSPEQLRGAKSLDHRADVWSLGVVMYRLLGGTVPHTGDTIADLIIKVCNEPAPPLRAHAPWVPEPVADLVHAALAIEASARTPTMQALGGALLKLTNGETHVDDSLLVRFEPTVQRTRVSATSIPPPAKAVAPPKRAPRGRFLLALAAAVAVGGAYGGYRWSRPGEPGWRRASVDERPSAPPSDAAPIPAKIAKAPLDWGTHLMVDDEGNEAKKWLGDHVKQCSPKGYPDVLSESPPPDTAAGVGVEIACAAIAGDLRYARAALVAEAGTASKFTVAHPVATYARALFLLDKAGPLALALASLGVEAEPNNPSLLLIVGTIQFQLGHDGPARDALERYRVVHPEDDRWHRLAGKMIGAMDDPKSCPRIKDGPGREIYRPGCP